MQTLLEDLGIFSDRSESLASGRSVDRTDAGFHLPFLSLVLLRVRVLLQAVQALRPLCWESLHHQLVQNPHLGSMGKGDVVTEMI